MSTSDQSISRLHEFRLSHCDTCGCARCREIDQLLDPIERPAKSTLQTNDDWMIEGRLQRDEHGQLTITRGDTIAALDDALSNWGGHHILILIGAREMQS
jgi:hypothetical protein